jgi:hypothetical protein
MNYSFFLFTQLYNEIIGIQYEYDLLYEDIKKLFYDYQLSSFNDRYKPEYECIVAFLKHNDKKIVKDCADRGLCILTEFNHSDSPHNS